MRNVLPRTALLTCGLIFAPLLLQCQSKNCIHDHEQIQRGQYLLHIGDTLNALATVDSAMQVVNYDTWSLIACTEASLMTGDTTRAIRYLERIYACGGRSMLTYSDQIKGLLARGFAEPELGRLRGAMDHWSAQADSVWILALIDMKDLDQSHRDFDALTRHNDSLNLERLIALTERRGFPSPEKVGASYGIVSLLLLHHRGELGMNERLRHFLDLAQPAMEACLVEPSFLSWIIDFEANEKGEATPYGTLIGYYRNDLEQIHLPVLETLNANRARVGLRPIQEFAEILAIPFEDLPFGR